MAMELYIMRHGHARDPQVVVANDDERPLTADGRDETADMARLLTQLRIQPTLILSSPLIRAWQTAEIVADLTGGPAPLRCEHMAPGGSVSGLLHDITSHPVEQRAHVLVTGHMPDVSRILATLCWNTPYADVAFRTAEIACVRLSEHDPLPGSGDLRWLLPPKLARRLVTAHAGAGASTGGGEDARG